MKYIKAIVLLVLVLTISLGSLSFSILYNSYNISYYESSFIKEETSKITSKDLKELSQISASLIEYLKKGDNLLLSPYFNDREIKHMEDVYNLYNLARLVFYLSAIITFIGLILLRAIKANSDSYRVLGLGLFTNHLIIGLLGLLAYINFNKYFTIFHEIFFRNDLWLLDPNTDLLIQMLPLNFFIGIALRIGVTFVIIISIFQAILLAIGSNRINRDHI